MGHGNHRKGNIVTPGFECNAQKVDYFDATIRTMYRNVTLLYFGVRWLEQTPPVHYILIIISLVFSLGFKISLHHLQILFHNPPHRQA